MIPSRGAMARFDAGTGQESGDCNLDEIVSLIVVMTSTRNNRRICPTDRSRRKQIRQSSSESRSIVISIVQYGFVTVSTRVHLIVDFPNPTDLFVNFGSRCREVDYARGKCRFYMLLYPCESLFVLLSLSLYFVLDALDPSHPAVQIIGRQGPSR
jgi:hypothetical protein